VPNRHYPAGGIVLEAAVVALFCAALAFAANELSPRGLNLGRNYFPSGTGTASVSPPKLSPPTFPSTNEDASAEVDQRLKDKGLQPLSRVETEKLFHDPRHGQGLIIFVDARDEDHYRDGHIPGAYELNPYHPEKELAQVLPVCQIALQVVVYCAGGECEDADSTALLLRDAGVPMPKLFVFGGGYNEWSERHLPEEKDGRNGAAVSPKSNE
jgi:rhodanese-related sulfurtransferase